MDKKQERTMHRLIDEVVESADNDDNVSMIIDTLPDLGIANGNDHDENNLALRLEVAGEIYAAMKEAACSVIRKYSK